MRLKKRFISDEELLNTRYVPEAAVMHSHNYTLRELYGRCFIEGEADAFIYDARPSVRRSVLRVAAAIKRDVAWQARELTTIAPGATIPSWGRGGSTLLAATLRSRSLGAVGEGRDETDQRA